MIVNENIEMLFMDRMEMLAKSNDSEYDWGLVDTEYGIKESSKNHESRSKKGVKQKNGKVMHVNAVSYTKYNWDDETPPFTYWAELYRTTKNFACFGANYFHEIVGVPFKPVKRADFSSFIKENPYHWIIWDKMNGDNDFNDCEMIYTTKKIKSRVVKYMWSGMLQGSMKNGEVAEGNKKLNEKRIHPTQKPVRIYEKLFIDLEVKGYVVDTGFGSGNICIASNNLGLKIRSCEIVKEYYDNGVRSVQNRISQLRMF